MKKILSVILASIVVLMCVVSCSNNSNTETTVSTSESTSPVDTTKETTVETTVETTTEKETTSEETTTEETTTSANQNEKITGNLVAGWLFDSIEDGYVKDVSGNGNDAKISGNPSIADGKDGGAINLSSVGDHLYVESSDSLKFSKTDSFSIIVTAKWNGERPESWPCIFNNGLNKAEKKFSYFGMWIRLSTPKMVFGFSGGEKENNIMSYLANDIDKSWHTYKIVQDGDSGNVFFYVDGIYQAVAEAVDIDSDVGAFIGYEGSGGDKGQFLGLIDEILIYKDKSGLESLDAMEYSSFRYKSEKQNLSVVMPFRVYYPSDYDINSKKQYPILFFLHGYGECGTDNVQQVRVNDVDNQLLKRVIEKDNCIIVAPQCREESMYNWIGVNKKWTTGSRYSLPANPTISLEAATALLNSFLDSGKVDRNRVYLSGLSMGGYGTWEMLVRNPDMFAAAIPVCGAGFPNLGYTLVDVNIWTFHGTDDPTVPFSGTQDMYNAIVNAGGKLINMTLYQGVQHNSWIQAYSEGKLLDWLFSCFKDAE